MEFLNNILNENCITFMQLWNTATLREEYVWFIDKLIDKVLPQSNRYRAVANDMNNGMPWWFVMNFQNIPKDWMGFKKFKTAYEKTKEKEAKEAYKIQQMTMPIMGNEEISELDPRQLVYVSEDTIEEILNKYPNREAYSMGNLRGATIVFKTQKNETMYDWKNLKRVR